MKFIRPTLITDAKLTSSSVPETDYTAWSAATNYTVGTRVTRAASGVHKNFENLIAGVNATLPENATTGATPRWLDLGPTNRWAMFDEQVGNATTATDSITVVMSPGRINSIALLDVDAATVTIDLSAGGESVYSKTLYLYSGNTIADWYQYFFEPVYQQDTTVSLDLVDATLIGLPVYGEGVLTVTLSRPGGTVSCGVLVVGLYTELGVTQYQPTIGIVDYSRKDTDTFGNTKIVKRGYSKRMTASVVVDAPAVDNVARVLAEYRSTALVFVGAGTIYTSMVIYGFYKDWELSVDNYHFSLLNLQVEGLTQ